jgi:hypothetical protein
VIKVQERRLLAAVIDGKAQLLQYLVLKTTEIPIIRSSCQANALEIGN